MPLRIGGFDLTDIRRKGAPPVQSFPWQITASSQNGQIIVKVKPGTINGLLPSNMFDTWTVGATGTTYVTLDCTTDGYNITDAEVDGNSTVPPDPFTSELNLLPFEFSILLGVIVDRRVFQTTENLLEATAKAGLQVLKDDPQPGEPYYDTYWTWMISSY